jgi:O-antigen/teichoic acid export membrane protein
VGATGIGKLISFFYVLVLARFLGPDHLGIFSFGIALSLALSAFTNFGQNIFLLRHLGKRRYRIGPVLSHSLTLRVLLSVIGVIIALMLLTIFWGSRDTSFFALAIILSAIVSKAFVYSARDSHVALEDSSWVPRYELIFRGAEALTGLVFLLIGGGLLAVSLVHAFFWGLEAVFATRLVGLRTGCSMRFGTSRRFLRRIIKESFPYTIGVGLFVLFPQFCIIALKVLGAEDAVVAHYSVASQFIFAIAMPGILLSEVLIPVVRRLQRSDRLQEIDQLMKVVGLMIAAGASVAVIITAFAPWLINLFFWAGI